MALNGVQVAAGKEKKFADEVAALSGTIKGMGGRATSGAGLCRQAVSHGKEGGDDGSVGTEGGGRAGFWARVRGGDGVGGARWREQGWARFGRGGQRVSQGGMSGSGRQGQQGGGGRGSVRQRQQRTGGAATQLFQGCPLALGLSKGGLGEEVQQKACFLVSR